MEIKILGQKYNLELKPIVSREEERAGQVCYATNTITLCSDLKPNHLQITLLHEVIHALLFQLGFYDETDNENLVCALSQSLYQVLVDNPEIFGEIKGALGEWTY